MNLLPSCYQSISVSEPQWSAGSWEWERGCWGLGSSRSTYFPLLQVKTIYFVLQFFFLFYAFIHLSLAALGLRCSGGFSLAAAPGSSLRGLLSSRSRASAAEAPGLRSTGSVVVPRGLSCSVARAISPDRGSNPCLLHAQADSLPLSQHGSPLLALCQNTLSYFLHSRRHHLNEPLLCFKLIN